ncbi:MAG TPA: CRISPR-associated protein Csx14 [Anaerolinea thermolimosa]|uniref:CRISPR-associated protein Csx14 n=1 Tax=Anaerolinea thermolimosa TaxID=229919 RepID=A0A3D1JFQ4_9CHLR|nr:CRISPR-associated ring nuclease [Anaerolinea thermolimosa]GAP08584.1 CRISPR-associated protein, Csx14 family [Anaerolinea thermolimosa]HCE17410.1 CRISPR-associated protein Csx14 [Anaerolinea thermolimosa]
MNELLIATLGTEPQGVTWMLDWLLQQGFAIDEVLVLHTSASVVEAALQKLKQEFPAYYPSIRFRHEVIRGTEGPIEDLASEKDTWAFLQSIYRAIRRARQMGQKVHLSLTGGRKTMAVYAMVAAQLLFGEQDRAWHMISEVPWAGTERRMHATPPDRYQVVAVPVVRWSDAATVQVLLAEVDDPWEALRRQQEFTLHEVIRRRREFWEHHLSPALRGVAELLVREGLDNAAIARRLGKSEHTIANQLTRIYRAFEDWKGTHGVAGGASRAAFIAEFASLFGQEPE